MRHFARMLGSALALALFGLASPAHAIFLEADHIEADGSFSTIDLWFFHFNSASTSTFQVNDVTGLVAGSDTDLIIYVDDGTFTNVFAADTTVGAEAAIPATAFAAGSYVAVVANSALAVGEFGPFQPDLALAVGGYDYELNGQVAPGDDDPVFDCILSGNLGGGYTKQVLGADTCQLPPAVPEPATFAILAVGLLAVGFAVRRLN